MKSPLSTVSSRLAIAFLVAALVPAGTMLYGIHRRDDQARIDEIEAHQLDLAQDRETTLEVHLDAIRRDAAILAGTPPVRDFLRALASGGDPEAAGPLAERLVRAMQDETWGATHHIFVTDASGAVVLSPVHGAPDVPCRAPERATEADRERYGYHLGASLATLPEFPRALREPETTSFFAFAERDHHHQLVLEPVRDDDGAPLGVVVVEVSIDAIDALIARDVLLGETGQVALVTLDGQRVTHLRKDDEPPIESPALARAIETGLPAFAQYETADGRAVLGTFVPSKRYPWVLGIEVDQAEALRRIEETHAQIAALALLMSAVLAATGLAVGHWFGAPLKRVARAATRVSEGSLRTPIPMTQGTNEIGALERATEAMRVRMLEQIETLDERVAQQTIELKAALEDARRSQQRLAHAVAGSMDGLWDWDLENDRVYYAPRWKELVGATPDEVGDTPDEWERRISPRQLAEFRGRLDDHVAGSTERFEMELEMLHADGGTRWMLCRAAAIRDEDGRARRIAGSLADITDLKLAQGKLARLAQHDQLTGLPNRALLRERLARTIARAKRYPERTYAVLFFDFDRFKVINDSLGHNVGDALLISIADRFRRELRAVDTAARFGGDEFVVLLDGLKRGTEAIDACKRLLRVFEKPHEIRGHHVVSTASIGLVMGTPAYQDGDDVLRDADAAMYQAKSAGRAQFRLFDDEMHRAARHRLDLENDLRMADLEAELRVLYQPIVAVDTCRIEGFEALLRWQHPKLGVVSPAEFIPIAEETGLINRLGEWVLRAACAQHVAWRAEHGPDRRLFMNVNVSRRQLVHPDFLPMLTDVVREHGIQRGELKLEITETAVMDPRIDLVPVMNSIRALGVLLAMDDFGTGQSSLSCLHRFPIDVLKIDRTFIENLERNTEFTAVIQAIVTLAHHLDLDVVAEGIEGAEQLAQLQVMDCEYAQGYLFSRPLEAGSARELLRTGFERKLSA